MADGKLHASSTKRNLHVYAGASIAVVFCEPTALPMLLGTGLGMLVGHILTPDMDHHFWTYEEYRVYRFSKVIGWVWWLYWYPYQKIHAHRGISHLLFVGTLGRFLYLFWYPLWIYGQLYMGLWLTVYLGMLLQDFQHLWLDRKPYVKHRKNTTRRIAGRTRRNQRFYTVRI